MFQTTNQSLCSHGENSLFSPLILCWSWARWWPISRHADPWRSRHCAAPSPSSGLGMPGSLGTVHKVHSYWTWPIYSGFTWIYPLKMVISHSYVSLPEGRCCDMSSVCDVTVFLEEHDWTCGYSTYFNMLKLRLFNEMVELHEPKNEPNNEPIPKIGFE